MHWCATHGLKARPLDIVGYGDEEEIGDTAISELEDGDAAASHADAHDHDGKAS